MLTQDRCLVRMVWCLLMEKHGLLQKAPKQLVAMILQQINLTGAWEQARTEHT